MVGQKKYIKRKNRFFCFDLHDTFDTLLFTLAVHLMMIRGLWYMPPNSILTLAGIMYGQLLYNNGSEKQKK